MSRVDGALAQLGEHLLCKQGVIGSIPIGSTILAASRLEWWDSSTRNSPGMKKRVPAMRKRGLVLARVTRLFDIVNGFFRSMPCCIVSAITVAVRAGNTHYGQRSHSFG